MRHIVLITLFLTLISCASTKQASPSKPKSNPAESFKQFDKLKASFVPADIYSNSLNVGVRFQFSPLNTVSKTDSKKLFKYHGNNGKFNASLTISDPHCNVEATNEHHFKCLLPKILSNPIYKVVKKSISVKKHDDGISLTYMVIIDGEPQKTTMMHTHLLFTHNGKWGDFHFSVMGPNQTEIIAMMDLREHLELITETNE